MGDVTRYVVLLRGVNVGGHRRVPAADLRAAAEDAGLHDAQTYANSGNLVASSGDPDARGGSDDGAPDVAVAVTDALAVRLGATVPMVALSAARWQRLVDAVPFPQAAADSPAQVLLHVGPGPVDADGVARLVAEHDGPELIATAEGALYVHYVEGLGRSRLTSARTDRATGTWTTGRNWRTVLRLLAMASG